VKVAGLSFGDIVGNGGVGAFTEDANLGEVHVDNLIVFLAVQNAHATHGELVLVLVAVVVELLLEAQGLALEVAGVLIASQELALVVPVLLVQSSCASLAFPVALALGRRCR